MMFLRSAAVWLMFILLETLNGAIRIFWLESAVGDLAAHQLSFLTGTLLMLSLATVFVRWIAISTVTQAISVGMLWMILTLGFEIGVGHVIVGASWEQFATDYNLLQGRLMGLGLAVLIIAPLLAMKIRAMAS